MQGFAESEIIRILEGQLSTVAAMAGFTLVEVSCGLKSLESDNDVVLDDFTPMLTLESNSDVTSRRSNNLSTSNYVSLDSRHWSPSSDGLRSGLCLYAFLGNALQGCEATHGSEALEWKSREAKCNVGPLPTDCPYRVRQIKNLEDDVYSFEFINDAYL
ncbi:hypothetical protein Tco_0280715 [Tanacetum coccineum]